MFTSSTQWRSLKPTVILPTDWSNLPTECSTCLLHSTSLAALRSLAPWRWRNNFTRVCLLSHFPHVPYQTRENRCTPYDRMDRRVARVSSLARGWGKEMKVELDGLLFRLAGSKEGSLGWPRGDGHPRSQQTTREVLSARIKRVPHHNHTRARDKSPFTACPREEVMSPIPRQDTMCS